MGRMKEGLILDDERGWRESDKNVCPRCVDDDYLRKLVRQNLTAGECDYCGRRSSRPIVASVNVLLEAIYPAVFAHFNDPNDAGVPVDEGEWFVEPWSIDEVLEQMGVEERADLLQDVIDAATNEGGWVPAADGHWASSQPNDLMMASWRDFAHTVKHVTRFHFANMPPSDASGPGDIDIRDLLPALAKHLRPMVVTLPVGGVVFRARHQKPGEAPWSPVEAELTAPPSNKATAGRMNPAGIRYLYTSFDRATALHEARIVSPVPEPVYIASFALTRPLCVVDLTKAMVVPSIFDLTRKTQRERALFVWEFVRAISKPVAGDDKEHLDYVPSQVVCEYLAQVFKTRSGEHLGGLIFPSAVHEGGRNLVVFPSEERLTEGFHGMNFTGANQHRFAP